MKSPRLPARSEVDSRKLIFELTNLCNFSCIHCLRDEEGAKHYLPVEIVDKVLGEARAFRNPFSVSFTGGEPTLHPRFAEIVERVVSHGHAYTFVTNGWHFQKVFSEIKGFASHLRSVHFSLDGAREETHDALRRRPGSFRRVMQAISLCRFHQVPVHINMVVTTANRAEIHDMAVLASRLGCAALCYAHCQPTPDGLAAGLVMAVRERRRVEAEIADLQRIFQLEILLAGDHYRESLFHQCPQLQMRELNIDYRGYLTACCMLSGYRGGTPDTEVLADLNQVSLFEAHRRLIAKIAEINGEKIERLALRRAGRRRSLHLQPLHGALPESAGPGAACDLGRGSERHGGTLTMNTSSERHERRPAQQMSEHRFKTHPNVVFTDLDESQAALLHLDSKRYYSVNATGARIWTLLATGMSPAAITAEIRKEYRVAQDDAMSYVLEFLEELKEEGLVQ